MAGNYKFLDVGCKIGGSFSIAKQFGFKETDGLGIDTNETHVINFKNKGYNAIVASATDIPFNDNAFDLVIFSHVLEHLPTEEMGLKALNECIRVSKKYIYLALPFFDEDNYLNSLGLKTFYSDWDGHTNMVHLKKILNEYLIGYKYELKMIKKLADSSAKEIHPLSSPINSLEYNEKIHPPKKLIKFDRDIWREFSIVITKQ